MVCLPRIGNPYNLCHNHTNVIYLCTHDDISELSAFAVVYFYTISLHLSPSKSYHFPSLISNDAPSGKNRPSSSRGIYVLLHIVYCHITIKVFPIHYYNFLASPNWHLKSRQNISCVFFFQWYQNIWHFISV